MRAGTRTPEDIKVKGQLGPRALRVLIRVQELVSARGSYDYVEIGSFLGRSLQSHLQDADCRRALSIDLRPDTTPDERGAMDIYQGITADDMIAGLAELCSADDLIKLETVTDTSDILRDMEADQFDLAFIDGEHTHTAAFRDFLNVLGVIRPNGVICFDDTTLVLTGIRNALTVLETRGVPHAFAFGRGGITVVALGKEAQAFIDALGEGMTIPEGRIERRTRRRMQEVALREAKPHLIAEDPKVRDKAIAALRADGWVVEPASTNEPA
ncbi:MAG: class I SAM-dependent methyltransferase [Silicimonas sp.]|nr:class I SAM-dependent methyltransferase [Silicimonas sp.]